MVHCLLNLFQNEEKKIIKIFYFNFVGSKLHSQTMCWSRFGFLRYSVRQWTLFMYSEYKRIN